MKFRWGFYGFLFVFPGLSNTAFSGELIELYRGARAQAMGNAFVAIADDEEAIFYNPAGLAGTQKHILNYMALDLSTSTDLILSYQEGLSAFKNLSGDSLNVIIGKNIFARSQFAPSFLMPNFGVAAIVDGQFAIESQNKALPQLTLGYQTTNGIQAGYGISLNRGFRRKGDLRFGIAAKILWRRGGYHLLPLLSLISLSQNTIKELSGSYERGIGLDFGGQYLFNFTNHFSASLGVAYTDVGDTYFGGQADTIKGNLTAGMALQYSLKLSKITFAYDFRHILNETDWRKKSHIGVEVAVPFLSIYGGINQVNLTYGASFDAWLFKITVLSFAEELGSFVHQDSMRQWLVKTALKFDL